MTLEDLGYKRVEEEETLSKTRVRYEKDATVYEVNGYVIPKDELRYYCRTILIFNRGVSCCIGISLNSFKHAREYSPENPLGVSYCLSWDEMKAILEMRELGAFNELY